MGNQNNARRSLVSTAETRPKVTVVLTTYNHAPYIAHAIEGVLTQRFNSTLELIIVEDCSTDATRNIVMRFAERHPQTIRLMLAETNQNDNSAYAQAILEARGDYIALLDGDDYWSSPDKLERQVNFLDANPSHSICFHNVEVIYSDGGTEPHPFHLEHPRHLHSRELPKPTSTLADIVQGNFIQTVSVMFRARLFDRFPDWFYEMPVADWPLHILNAAHGDIGYINRLMAVYRVHPQGLWSSNISRFDTTDKVDAFIRAYEVIDLHFGRRFHGLIHSRSRWLFEAGAKLLYRQGRMKEGNRYVMRYLNGLPMHRWFGETSFLLRMLRAKHPVMAGIGRQLRTSLNENFPAHDN